MRTLLIANRGEIAVRIARACRERGIRSVAVYSAADADALHVHEADEAIPIGPPPPTQSYLSIERLIDAARLSGADALHPGYGFLSEQPDLAEACVRAGLTFVGPSAETIRHMGSKIAARELMEAAGVPCVPGARATGQDQAALTAAAHAIGFPVIVKASAGGGGKGMRRVDDPRDLAEAIDAARREAAAAFGDDTLLVERYVERARHVEIQIFGDSHGRVIHLGERECSVQRRHQKVVEESPSPLMTPALRERMGRAAVAAARAVGYRNAGTVEFLVDGTGDEAAFYFLEMNTRLQVEHPVTEAVTGLDLVHLQIDVAEGRPLPVDQSAVTFRGHAIECRIYAEDPAQGFIPQAGRLLRYQEPQGPGIRVDAGVREGDEVSPYYDPLLAKLVVQAPTREMARARALAALQAYVVLGIRTNIAYVHRILEHPDMIAGAVDTAWLEREARVLHKPPAAWILETAGRLADEVRRHQADPRGMGHARDDTRAGMPPDPWDGPAESRAGHPAAVDTRSAPGSLSEGAEQGAVPGAAPASARAKDRDRAQAVRDSDDQVWVALAGETIVVPAPLARRRQAGRTSDPAGMTTPMPATVTRIFVAPGDTVEAGATVLVLEAMKMELPVRAPRAGRVAAVRCAVGDLVQPGRALVELEDEPA
jgi:acetyl-CoA/propionyl-CoA carboxylase, biotin carboxylase, biotin carboxyl carrier protein